MTTIVIPKVNWNQFFKEVSKKRFAWETKIEVISDLSGRQILSNGLYLDGIDFEDKSGNSEVEILVSKNKHQHQTHKIFNPMKISYLSEDRFHDAIIEIVEKDGTLTTIKIFNPMPIMVGDAAYHSIKI